VGLFDSIGGFLEKAGESIFTPSNIIGAFGAYNAISSKGDAEDAALALEERKFNNTLALEDKQLQNAIALLQAKAALGEGGGGGGGGGAAAASALAYQKQKDKYEGRLGAMNTSINANQQAGSLVVQALLNLADLAQKPGLTR
jgi:hypothetical protein